MSEANLALVQQLYAAFGRGDIAAVLDMLADDIEWREVGRPQPQPRGRSSRANRLEVSHLRPPSPCTSA